MKRVAVLHAQVPFNRGGAEALVEGFVAAINRDLPGVTADLIQLPFKWYPEEQILTDMMAWRLLDLSETCGEKIDLVIGTKFPSYAVKHDNKVVWLVHQHRVLYDLGGSQHDQQVLSPRDLAIRNKIRVADTKMVQEAKCIYSISQTVTDRLLHFNSVESTPLAPPSIMSEQIYTGQYGDYIVCIARINRMKRQHLIIEALKYCPTAKVIFIGGGDRQYQTEMEMTLQENGLLDRCVFAGFTETEVLLKHLANARAVFYAPYDEDYGYAAIEGFLAKKPLITCLDSGEVRNFAESTGSGWCVPSDAAAIGEVLNQVYRLSAQELERLAENGYQLAKTVTWTAVFDEIVTPYL